MFGIGPSFRTGYVSRQYAGLIRRVRVNGSPIQLAGDQEADTSGLATVLRCSSSAVRRFTDELTDEEEIARVPFDYDNAIDEQNRANKKNRPSVG